MCFLLCPKRKWSRCLSLEPVGLMEWRSDFSAPRDFPEGFPSLPSGFHVRWFCVKSAVCLTWWCKRVVPVRVLGLRRAVRRGPPSRHREDAVSCNFSAVRYHTVPLGESVELAGSVPRAPRASLSLGACLWPSVLPLWTCPPPVSRPCVSFTCLWDDLFSWLGR